MIRMTLVLSDWDQNSAIKTPELARWNQQLREADPLRS